MVILLIACLFYGWMPDPAGMLAVVLALLIIMILGTALALLFSAANVFFRDWASVVNILTNFVRFGVPMIYPYSMVEERFGAFADYYLLNPIADRGAALPAGLLGRDHRPSGGAGQDRPAPTPLRHRVRDDPCLPGLPGVRAAGVQPPRDQDPGAHLMTESIRVENVTKEFTLRYHRTFKQVTVAMLKGRKISDTFSAVDDVSFNVSAGESIGLMGLNGSGKSTLLKMINGVMRPDVGTVRTRGRIAGLIATGAGFHPQLSGNENIRLNAAILGMSEKEIDRKYDEIVAFSEIDTKFLQTEVGHYSSGMSARLGFSVAIHVDSEIFLADEVLAVGDRPFKRKCLQKMEEVRDSGRTLFYVSHAAGSVRKMCTRVLILEKGRLIFDGDVDEGIKLLHYDDDKAENEPDRDEELEADEELGADI